MCFVSFATPIPNMLSRHEPNRRSSERLDVEMLTKESRLPQVGAIRSSPKAQCMPSRQSAPSGPRWCGCCGSCTSDTRSRNRRSDKCYAHQRTPRKRGTASCAPSSARLGLSHRYFWQWQFFDNHAYAHTQANDQRKFRGRNFRVTDF